MSFLKNNIIKFLALVVLVVCSTAALQRKTEGLGKLEKTAATGDSIAQLRLGNAYYFGRRGAQINYDLAFKWYKRAVDSGSISALFNLGLCHDAGHGTEKNEFKAFECYKEAAEVGLPQAKFNLALLYHKGVRDGSGRMPRVPRNAKLAQKLLIELCDKEFTPAYRELAKIFLDSHKKSEHAKARPLLEKAAANGDAIAMNLLSDCFSKGVGSAKNEPESVKWLKKAAANGSVEATGKLAYRYENGNGVERDLEKAFRFYKMAAVGGLPMAQAKLGDYFAFGQGGVKRNIPEAKKWYARAALSHNPKALFYLGTFAMQGIGEKKDVEKAAKLFILAA
ncbi:MAG: sel1 repeat family protein, partial [Victivallales bacterium]|nr:sel1 repeat family protein [Victivallales bacterium]